MCVIYDQWPIIDNDRREEILMTMTSIINDYCVLNDIISIIINVWMNERNSSNDIDYY